MGCNSITVGPDTTTDCPDGTEYTRTPFLSCGTGYTSARVNVAGIEMDGSTCYCNADPAAMAKLACVNSGLCTEDPLSGITKYWMYIVAAIVLILLLRK